MSTKIGFLSDARTRPNLTVKTVAVSVVEIQALGYKIGYTDMPDRITSLGVFFLFSLLIFIYLLKCETIVSRNGLWLGYSQRDTSSVCRHINAKIRTFDKDLPVF